MQDNGSRAEIFIDESHNAWYFLFRLCEYLLLLTTLNYPVEKQLFQTLQIRKWISTTDNQICRSNYLKCVQQLNRKCIFHPSRSQWSVISPQTDFVWIVSPSASAQFHASYVFDWRPNYSQVAARFRINVSIFKPVIFRKF